MKNGYYSPKEFAEHCRIPIDTLEYYRKICLLPPYKIGENGYGYYSPEQEYTLQLIILLRDAGCSLNEIKQFLYVGGIPEFQTILEKKKKNLLAQKDRIERSLRAYDYYQHFRRTTLDLATTKLRIVDNPESFYIFQTDVDPELSNSVEYRSLKFREHLIRCSEYSSEIMGFPVGLIYSEKAMHSLQLDKISGYCSYCMGVPSDPSNFVCIPQAKYMTYLYTDNTRNADKEIIARLLAFAEDNCYEATGDLFIIPFTKFINNNHISLYNSRIFVAVKEMP